MNLFFLLHITKTTKDNRTVNADVTETTPVKEIKHLKKKKELTDLLYIPRY